MERIEDEQRALRKQMNEEYVGQLNMIGDHGQRIVRLEERGSLYISREMIWFATRAAT
jgi:hypothetical protein